MSTSLLSWGYRPGLRFTSIHLAGENEVDRLYGALTNVCNFNFPLPLPHSFSPSAAFQYCNSLVQPRSNNILGSTAPTRYRNTFKPALPRTSRPFSPPSGRPTLSKEWVAEPARPRP